MKLTQWQIAIAQQAISAFADTPKYETVKDGINELANIFALAQAVSVNVERVSR